MTSGENVYDLATTEIYTEAFPKNPSRQMATNYVAEFIGSKGITGSLIDFGCGSGEDAFEVEPQNIEYFGSDLSVEMLDYGHKRGVSRTVASDLETLPFKENVFDIGMSLWALQYKNDLGSTLTEWHRVLKDDAPLLLVVPNPVYKFAKYSRNYFLEGQQWEEGLGINRFNYYHTFSNYFNSLISAGFEIESVHEPQREQSDKLYSGIPKSNIPHDLIIEARTKR